MNMCGSSVEGASTKDDVHASPTKRCQDSLWPFSLSIFETTLSGAREATEPEAFPILFIDMEKVSSSDLTTQHTNQSGKKAAP